MEGDDCSSDSDCQIQMVCAAFDKTNKKKCQKAYSLGIGETAYDGRLC